MSSSKSSVRIVLVDPLGEILFSGKSLSADTAASDAETEPCPETQRSAGNPASGTYRCAEIGHVASERGGRVA